MNQLRDLIVERIQTKLASDDSSFFRRPLVGFAAASDPLFAEIRRQVGPHHWLPTDILPEAKSVISYYLPFTEELVAGNRSGRLASAGWAKAYVHTNNLINEIARDLVDFMRSEGLAAAAVPSTNNFDLENLRCAWSHRSAAQIAGLGRFGLNRMLIGPSGCAGRYGTVFSSAELKPSPREMEERCLYLREGKCGACLKACPVGALSREGYDNFKCRDHIYDPANKVMFDGQKVEVCGKCVSACPLALAG